MHQHDYFFPFLVLHLNFAFQQVEGPYREAFGGFRDVKDTMNGVVVRIEGALLV